MTASTRTAGLLVGVGLLVSVLSQIVYMVLLGGPSPADPEQGITNADVVRYFTERWPEIAAVWTTEIVAFAAIAIGSLIALANRAPATIAWAALLLSAIFNILQAGIGLSMFAPAATAGEELAPVFSTIVGGAFFFYFFAKLMIGTGAAALGAALFGRASGLGKIIAVLAAFGGLGAAVVNLAALPQGMALTELAGGTGTIAALFAGLAALLITRGSKE